MPGQVKAALSARIGDQKLAEELFKSYDEIAKGFVSQNPIHVLQNTGLFVEAVLRVAEQLVTGSHVPLSKKLATDACIERLEDSSGLDALRIHAARLSRAVFDFRSRKKSVHLTAVDPEAIDASLIYNIATWIMIEILRTSGIPDAEATIKLLFTTKTPLVQRVGGIIRTTNPKLSGPQRILLLLYTEASGLTEEQLLAGTKQKNKDANHLRTNLREMDKSDLIHKLPDGKWTLFGSGYRLAEETIQKFC